MEVGLDFGREHQHAPKGTVADEVQAVWINPGGSVCDILPGQAIGRPRPFREVLSERNGQSRRGKSGVHRGNQTAATLPHDPHVLEVHKELNWEEFRRQGQRAAEAHPVGRQDLAEGESAGVGKGIQAGHAVGLHVDLHGVCPFGNPKRAVGNAPLHTGQPLHKRQFHALTGVFVLNAERHPIERPHAHARAVEHVHPARVVGIANQPQLEQLTTPQRTDQHFTAKGACQGPGTVAEGTRAESLGPPHLPSHASKHGVGIEHVLQEFPREESALLGRMHKARGEGIGPLVGPHFERCGTALRG